ncbi:baseplate assembly protein [Comamonas terrigena]|uniref:baseplate assembly protein n=1 Tax=Comamonas terrigena TaxID=32013 RepID=UPI00244BEFD1|nr:baseplate J/gp47 family protein [Comamonas terrigena]MDH0050285.1 baseplate J/gp47 family protein [Comamonas terrigena]MDH0512658.1 baseplate J/gp47 family protein [Comamonas terrigena]MDH1092893.1 baseplate J/gp47 family protein [Comamonas terrigena]MDH1502711.1 baseplate J/gp47 family protein [Comamonas terrigena]
MSLPEPDFIARDPQAITQEIIAHYEQLTGKTLYPAQVERVLIDVIAYRETLVRIGIQEAAKQNLLAFARAPMIDYLGELVGVTRLPAIAARTTLQFVLKAPRATSLLIPAGTRVDGADGKVIFATDQAVTLAAGALTVDAAATCEEPGADGNGWQPGQITNLVDEIDDVDLAVANTIVTSAGAAEELDDRLRERIKLAPEAYSTAGSRLAYVFHAKSAHQDIVDVAVISPEPGVVHLYPLMATGLPDANILSLVEAKCSGEKVRPLTDNVKAKVPESVDYFIDVELELYKETDADSVVTLALEAAEAYKAQRAAGLGRDIVPVQLESAIKVAGVYDITRQQPSKIVLAAHQWANCTGINVVVTGEADG